MEEILDLIEGLSTVNENNFIEKLPFIEESFIKIKELLQAQVSVKRTITKEQAELLEVKFQATNNYLNSVFNKVLNN